jgi:trk system potassium uptake protein TrkA
MSLAQSSVRSRYRITVVGVKSPGKPFTYATADTVVSDHDLIIVSGATSDVESFSAIG